MSLKIDEICSALNADVQTAGDADREINSVIAGDLLSFVMGTVDEGAAWVTIQTHLNVAAVAVLKDLPLILIASGRQAAPELIERCARENICVAVCPHSVYEICGILSKLGLEG